MQKKKRVAKLKHWAKERRLREHRKLARRLVAGDLNLGQTERIAGPALGSVLRAVAYLHESRGLPIPQALAPAVTQAVSPGATKVPAAPAPAPPAAPSRARPARRAQPEGAPAAASASVPEAAPAPPAKEPAVAPRPRTRVRAAAAPPAEAAADDAAAARTRTPRRSRCGGIRPGRRGASPGPPGAPSRGAGGTARAKSRSGSPRCTENARKADRRGRR